MMNMNLLAAVTPPSIYQEVSIDYSTTHVKEELPETPKAFEKSSIKDTPHKRKATMMASSKTRNYHICEIIHNLYEDNTFQKKK